MVVHGGIDIMLLRTDMEIACALAAYFKDKMKQWGEPIHVGIVMNNTFTITDDRLSKRYEITVKQVELR